jgi:hypothetical protein
MKQKFLFLILIFSLITNLIFIGYITSNTENNKVNSSSNQKLHLNQLKNKLAIWGIEQSRIIDSSDYYQSKIVFTIRNIQDEYEPLMIVGDSLGRNIELFGKIDTLEVVDWVGNLQEKTSRKGKRDFTVLVYLPDSIGKYDDAPYILQSSYIVK